MVELGMVVCLGVTGVNALFISLTFINLNVYIYHTYIHTMMMKKNTPVQVASHITKLSKPKFL